MAFAPSSAGAGVGTYFKDRGNDFLDIFRLRAGVPQAAKGVGLKARATTLVQVGYVFFDGTYYGLDRRGFGVVDEKRFEGGISALYGSLNQMEPVHGNEFLRANTLWSEGRDRRILRNLPYWDDGRRRPLSFGVEVMTPVLGFDVGLYPSEAFDFVLGIFTIDAFGDDQLRLRAPRYMRAATPPGPAEEAPFAERRESHQEMLDAWEEDAAMQRLIDAGQLEAPPARPPEEAPVAPPPEEDGEWISPEEADEAIRDLETEAVPAPEYVDDEGEDEAGSADENNAAGQDDDEQ